MHFSQSATSVNNNKPQSLDLNLLDIAFFLGWINLFDQLGVCLSRDRSGVQSTIVLLPLLGITWIFGVLTFNSETLAFQYLFAIFNSLQVRIRHAQLAKLLPLTFRNVKTLYLRFIYPPVPVGKVSGLLFHRCILKPILLLSEEKEMALIDR